MKKRICIVRHSYYPLDVRVRRQATALTRAGFEVDIVCLRQPGELSTEVIDGVRVYRLPLTHRRASRLRYAILYASSLFLCGLVVSIQHLRRHYDLVQVSTMPDCLVFAGTIPKLLGAFILLDILDPMPELYAAKYGVTLDALGARLLSIQEGASIRFADGVLTVLDEVRQLLIKRHGIRRIDVILNCPDHTVLPRRSNALPQGEGGNSTLRPFVLLSHGSLVDRLGYDTIIDAVALLRTRIPNLVLRIVGHGDGRHSLAARAQARGVCDRVQIFQGVVLDQIPELIESSDIGVVANKSDPFADLPLPTKLLEFAWMGKPVVSARTTTIGHYFDDSQVAFFEPGNAADLASRIEELYNDPRRRVLLAQNAGRFFDRYNWPNEARRYVDLVSGLIDRGTQAGTDARSEHLSKAQR